jgi:2-polyprenyl-6-hydroxyphenyl methylase/3-demethylubiquinone-9 3-methyltransferase
MSEDTTAQRELRFEFGRNWQSFVRRNLDDERIGIARDHIVSFLGRKDLTGLDFLDIGCGSGINSAAARSAGAGRIFSFDYDPNSVAATQSVRTRKGDQAAWQVQRGDVLDDAFMQSLGKWNFVYSWGVLHHTGEVWHAVDNASKTVADNGLFYIALYSADVEPNPDFWLRIKREYNQASAWKKNRMVWWYVWNYVLSRRLRRIPSLISKAINYRKSRGMSMLVDIRDWLGGWPMEYTRDADVVAFLDKRGFKLENMKTGEACSEFLFVKRS